MANNETMLALFSALTDLNETYIGVYTNGKADEVVIQQKYTAVEEMMAPYGYCLAYYRPCECFVPVKSVSLERVEKIEDAEKE